MHHQGGLLDALPGASHRVRTRKAPPPKGGGLAGAAPVQNLEEMEKAAAEKNAAAPWPSSHMKPHQSPATNPQQVRALYTPPCAPAAGPKIQFQNSLC